MSRMGRCRSASAVPTVSPLACWGFLKRTSPASWSGLTEMIRAPRDFASSSADSIRGWLVPGFCPTTRISLAWWMSSRLTEPFPIPIVSTSADPEDSWHMLEQSGRLLVPKERTKSW